MNKYYDPFLDEYAIKEIDKAIDMQGNNPAESYNILQRLASQYPKSPQIQISLSILFAQVNSIKSVEHLQPYYRKAIELDPNFWQGHRHYTNSLFCEAMIYEGTSAMRAQTTPYLMEATILIKTGVIPAIVQSLVENAGMIFKPNYREIYNHALAERQEAYNKLTKDRYDSNFLASIEKDLRNLTDAKAQDWMMMYQISNIWYRTIGALLSGY